MTRLCRRTALHASAIGLLLLLASPARPGQKAPPDPLARTLDAMLTKLYPADAPGAAVIAVRDGKTVLRKGYGMADLELRVPIEPEMVFRIGSMTKQFTAVAILMLVEDGKLSLSDPISRFLPEDPTHGKPITIEHLLTHSSGLKNYTDRPEYRANLRNDYTVQQMIGQIKDEPLQFEPGERYAYDNTGYFLLGAVVEKASGTSYEAFLKTRIFDVAGMTRTSLDDTSRVIPGRVRGYQKAGDGWTNADWVSMTQPYAAGAIVSTVDDLARWDAALDSGRLLRPETLKRAFTRHVLASGETIDYGYGWQPGDWEGFTTLQHGGGIQGFVSMGVRVPERRVYVAVLSNQVGGTSPTPIAQRIATHLLGKPWEPKRVELSAATLDSYVGIYANEHRGRFVVTSRDGRLDTQSTAGTTGAALPLSESDFFYERSLDRLHFERDAEGRVTGLVRKGFGTAAVRYARTAEMPKPRKEVRLTSEQLERCVGRYELGPGFVLAITRDGERLLSQATGQPRFEIFAESETEFFVKVFESQLSFEIDGAGPAKAIVIHQGGRDTRAKRVE